MALGQKLREYFHTEYQPGERKLVQKIDFFILTFCCLSYFCNYVSLSAHMAILTHSRSGYPANTYPVLSSSTAQTSTRPMSLA